ncbi:MAG: hypothetical protein LBJ64_06640 [Deltaproteobacteria bacterium]|jgi:MraZ protein|nr:hypothetical protein [Deltaproteobacteria bacterium]
MALYRLSFTGRYDHVIDDKGRIMLSSNLRDMLSKSEFSDSLHVGHVPGTDFLSVYPYERWKVLVEDWTDEKRFPSTQVMLDSQRLFFANIEPMNVDKAGRVLVPSRFRDKAGLKSECAILGVGEKMELWVPAKLDEKEAADMAAFMKLSSEESAKGLTAEENRLPSF